MENKTRHEKFEVMRERMRRAQADAHKLGPVTFELNGPESRDSERVAEEIARRLLDVGFTYVSWTYGRSPLRLMAYSPPDEPGHYEDLLADAKARDDE